MIYIDEIIKAKVDLAAIELGYPVYFQHGHPLEIVGKLKVMSEAKSTKGLRYPLVALFRDFNERKGFEVGIASEADLNLIIATRTEPTYDSDKRKAESFKAVLHPILEALEKQILIDGRSFLTSGTGLGYTQIDRYFWGRESIYGVDGNIFNDYIDCVEIRNLNLKFKTPNC